MNDLEKRCQQIQMILSDVDGVLTDSGIYYSNSLEEIKRFDAQDGFGIRLWQMAGYQFGIITGRSSNIVKYRGDELNLSIIRQGVRDKWDCVSKIAETFGLTAEEICFVGDDFPDLPVIKRVGLGATVPGSPKEVAEAAHWISTQKGGFGAVRELIETILKAQNRWNAVIQNYMS